jgi:hypothetical protein
MEFILSISGYLVGVPLELLIIGALLHGGYRRFPLVFVYIIAEFLGTVIEMPQALAWYRSHDPHVGHRYAWWYWTDEIVLQVLVFAVVISLIWQATSAARSRRPLRVALILGVILFAGTSFLFHFSPKTPTGVWMTAWKRDLNFGSAILDMALWALLIAKRQKDSRVLMLSGGLGVMFTGEAIGESLRNLGKKGSAIALPGGVLVMIINLLFLYIWWQTFRAPRPVLVSDP